MAIEINYTVEKNEFLKHRLKMLLLRPFTLVLAIPFLGVLWSAYSSGTSDNWDVEVLKPLIILCLFLVLYLTIIIYSLNKAYNNAEALQQGVCIILNQENYYSKTNTTESTASWSQIKKVKLYSNFLDIYFNKIQIAGIPRRFLNDNDLIELKEILENNQVKNNL